MRIARVFFDVHMGKNFDGLQEICKESKLDSETAYVIFINTARTKFKLMVANKYIVYYSNGNTLIPMDAIQHIPAAFNGNEFQFSKAIKHSILEKLNKRYVGTEATEGSVKNG